MSVLPYLRLVKVEVAEVAEGGSMEAKAKAKERNEEPRKRSVILPEYLWEVIDKDADRCRRSATKQLEVILLRYYQLEANIELNEGSLAEARHERRKVA